MDTDTEYQLRDSHMFTSAYCARQPVILTVNDIEDVKRQVKNKESKRKMVSRKARARQRKS